MSDSFEENRRKEREVQEKQLFAQRVAAAASVANAAASAEQVRLQAQQLRLTEEHAARVESLALHQAAAEQVHREFTKDIQWLDRCDPNGKFDFFVTKVQKEFIDTLSLDTLRCFTTENSMNDEKTRFDRAFQSFVAANAKLQERNAVLADLEKILKNAKQSDATIPTGCATFGCLPLGAILLICGVFGANGEACRWGSVLILFSLGLRVYLGAEKKNEVKQNAKKEIQRKEITPKLLQAQKEVSDAVVLCQRTLAEAKDLYDAWTKSCSFWLPVFVQRSFDGVEAKTLLLKLIEGVQEQYPPLSRVEIATIESRVLNEKVLSLKSDVVDATWELHNTSRLPYAMGLMGENLPPVLPAC